MITKFARAFCAINQNVYLCALIESEHEMITSMYCGDICWKWQGGLVFKKHSLLKIVSIKKSNPVVKITF